MVKHVVLFAALLTVPTVASAATILIDDFQSVAAGSAPSSSIWTTGSGQVVVDPLNPLSSNQVLHFTSLASGGDIWTNAAFGSGWLIFDFYGTTGPAGQTGATDSGGFIGWDVDQANAGLEQWLGGTNPLGGPVRLLADNAGWQTYAVAFTVPALYTQVYFKVEDWVNSDALAGDAYFDNIRFSDTNPAAAVPEPATFLLVATGLGSLAARRRRRNSDDPA